MENTENDMEIRSRAEKRVNELKRFYHHLLAYVMTNISLFLINLFTSPGDWWFVWPMLGWGIGLVCHALTTLTGGLFSAAWKERKIRELTAKYKNENNI